MFLPKADEIVWRDMAACAYCDLDGPGPLDMRSDIHGSQRATVRDPDAA